MTISCQGTRAAEFGEGALTVDQNRSARLGEQTVVFATFNFEGKVRKGCAGWREVNGHL